MEPLHKGLFPLHTCSPMAAAVVFLLLLFILSNERQRIHVEAVTGTELCRLDSTDGLAMNIMGRSYSSKLSTLLKYFCNFADSRHSTNVQACESFMSHQFVDHPTIVLRGSTSNDKTALRSGPIVPCTSMPLPDTCFRFCPSRNSGHESLWIWCSMRKNWRMLWNR